MLGLTAFHRLLGEQDEAPLIHKSSSTNQLTACRDYHNMELGVTQQWRSCSFWASDTRPSLQASISRMTIQYRTDELGWRVRTGIEVINGRGVAGGSHTRKTFRRQDVSQGPLF